MELTREEIEKLIKEGKDLDFSFMDLEGIDLSGLTYQTQLLPVQI